MMTSVYPHPAPHQHRTFSPSASTANSLPSYKSFEASSSSSSSPAPYIHLPSSLFALQQQQQQQSSTTSYSPSTGSQSQTRSPSASASASRDGGVARTRQSSMASDSARRHQPSRSSSNAPPAMASPSLTSSSRSRDDHQRREQSALRSLPSIASNMDQLPYITRDRCEPLISRQKVSLVRGRKESEVREQMLYDSLYGTPSASVSTSPRPTASSSASQSSPRHQLASRRHPQSQQRGAKIFSIAGDDDDDEDDALLEVEAEEEWDEHEDCNAYASMDARFASMNLR